MPPFRVYEAVVDGLNPLTISHAAKIISCAAMGRAKISNDEGLRLNILKGAFASHNAAPIRPKTDSHRGMSLDLYSK